MCPSCDYVMRKSQLPPFCLGYRYGRFAKPTGGATPTAALALALGAGTAVEARVGLLWVNAVQGSTNADIALETGVGIFASAGSIVPKDTHVYVPLALSFILHQ